MILGLVGTTGAGKTTVATYLAGQGFRKIVLSDFLRVEAKRRKISPVTKEVLQDIGNELREKYGSFVLAAKALEKIDKQKIKKAVIDGIRNLEEIAFLQKRTDFYLLGIDADPFSRFQRVKEERGDSWVGDFRNFSRIEKRENNLGSKKDGLRVKDCLKKALLVVKNDSTKEVLFAKLEKFLEKID